MNERFGPTIGYWLATPSAGRRARLAAICEMLGLVYPPAPNLRYQLFHRTAAAVVEARGFGTAAAAMIVHSFSPDHRWFDDFADFCEVFAGAPGSDAPACVRLPAGLPLTLGWASHLPG